MPIKTSNIDFSLYIPEIVGLPIDWVIENLLAGVYPEEKSDLIIRYIVQSGCQFSPDNFSRLLRSIGDFRENTFAHIFASREYEFSISDLLVLGNPKNNYGWTVAQEMAKNGHRFSESEIDALGDSVPKDVNTLSFLMKDYQERLTTTYEWSNIVLKLVFKDGKPLFTDGDRIGRHLCLDFCEYGYDYHLDVQNRFRIYLKQTDDSGSNWSAIMTMNKVLDKRRYLYEQIKVEELVKTLNEAIRNGQELDFSEQGKQFHQLDENLCLLIVFNDTRLDNLLIQTDFFTNREKMPKLVELMFSCEDDGFTEVLDGMDTRKFMKKRHNLRLSSIMPLGGYRFTVAEIEALGYSETNYSILNIPISVDEINQLPKDSLDLSLWDYMAWRGYPFTVEEIIRLGNPRNVLGLTLAENMLLAGHQFSENEIRELEEFTPGQEHTLRKYVSMGGKTLIDNGKLESEIIGPLSENLKTALFLLKWVSKDERYTDDEIRKSRVPRKDGRRFTEAFCMARAGYLFTVGQIKAIGNPKDDNGLTIADWMAKGENPLTAEELEQLKQ